MWIKYTNLYCKIQRYKYLQIYCWKEFQLIKSIYVFFSLSLYETTNKGILGPTTYYVGKSWESRQSLHPNSARPNTGPKIPSITQHDVCTLLSTTSKVLLSSAVAVCSLFVLLFLIFFSIVKQFWICLVTTKLTSFFLHSHIL